MDEPKWSLKSQDPGWAKVVFKELRPWMSQSGLQRVKTLDEPKWSLKSRDHGLAKVVWKKGGSLVTVAFYSPLMNIHRSGVLTAVQFCANCRLLFSFAIGQFVKERAISKRVRSNKQKRPNWKPAYNEGFVLRYPVDFYILNVWTEFCE